MSGAFVLEEVLRAAVEQGASDIHLKVPSRPILRVHGALERLEQFGPVTPAIAEDILAVMLSTLPHSAKPNEFERVGDVDFAYSHVGLGRFRVNAFRQRGSISIVIRLVPFGVPRLEDLGLPPSVPSLVEHADGLVAITGPAGSGVTTTIAALVDRLNTTVVRNVVTLDDPIEVLHSDRLGTVSQREVGLDTPSFSAGLARALRHDPDVVVVGALPDLETVEAVLTLARSGVLVLVAGTSRSVGTALERIVNAFPEERQRQARIDLASCLRGVVTQQLVPRADGPGRIAAAEVLLGTAALREAITAGAGATEITAFADSMDASLARLVAAGHIDRAAALDAARNRDALAVLLGG